MPEDQGWSFADDKKPKKAEGWSFADDSRWSFEENNAPAYAKPLPPYGLRSVQQKLASPNAPTFQNPRTGRTSVRLEPGESNRGPLGAVLDAPFTGIKKTIHGVEHMAQPGMKAKAEGLGDVIGGLAETATPAMVASGLYAPVKTAAALAGGLLSQQTAEQGLNALGLPPEYSRLAGYVAAIPGAMGGARIASPRLGSALKAGARAAGPDIAKGTGKVAGAVALSEVTPAGVPNHALSAAMGYPFYRGAKQIVSGLKKGFGAAREDWSPPREYVGLPGGMYSPVPGVGITPRPLFPLEEGPVAGTRAPNAQLPPPVPRPTPEPRSPVGNPPGQYTPSQGVGVTATPAPMPPEVTQGGFMPRGNAGYGKPSPALPKAPRGPSAALAPVEDPMLDGLARGMGGQSFAKLSPERQAVVRSLAEKMGGGLFPEPPRPNVAPPADMPPRLGPDPRNRNIIQGPSEYPPAVELPPTNQPYTNRIGGNPNLVQAQGKRTTPFKQQQGAPGLDTATQMSRVMQDAQKLAEIYSPEQLAALDPAMIGRSPAELAELVKQVRVIRASQDLNQMMGRPTLNPVTGRPLN